MEVQHQPSGVPFRLARELTFQLDQAGEPGRLAEALAQPDILLTLYGDSTHYDVLGYWSRLRDEGFSPGEYYGGWVEQLEAGRPDDLSRLLRTAAKVLDDLGEYAAALPLLHRVVEIAVAEDLTEDGARAAIDIGSIEALRGRFAEGLPMLEEGLRLARQTGDRHLIATALRGIGNLHYYARRFDRAREYWEQDLELGRELNDYLSIIKAYGNLGNYYVTVGDYDRAAELYEESLAGFHQLGDRHGCHRQLMNIANLFVRREMFDRALDSFNEVLALAEELGNIRMITMVLQNLAFAYTESGNPLKALPLLQRCINMPDIDPPQVAEHLRSYGFTLTQLERWDEALEYFERGLALSRSVGATRVSAAILANLTILFTEHPTHPDRERAIASAESSLALAAELDAENDFEWVARRLAELRGGEGNRAEPPPAEPISSSQSPISGQHDVEEE